MSSDSGSNQSQISGLAQQFGFNMLTSNVSFQWPYKELIESRTFFENLLKQRFDTQKFGKNKDLLQILTYGNGAPKFGQDTLIFHAIESLQNIIKLKKIKQIYELNISTSDPNLSKDMLNAILDNIDKFLADYNLKQIKETRQFIEERLIDTKVELETAEEALKVFREQNRSIFESPQLQLEQERLIRDVTVLIAVFTTLKQQLETAKINEVKESDFIVILDKPTKPIYAYSPQKRKMTILAGLLGIGSGTLLAFVIEYIKSIKWSNGDFNLNS